LKCENLQRAGSYKIRGAYVRIARLSPQERARGVVAASAGNHAQGVALAASLLGTSATIFMPHGAALPKIMATKGYGAEVLAAGRPVPVPRMTTIADGIAVGCPGEVPFAHVQELVDEIVTVTDEDLSRALLTLLERGKLVVEPAGAAGVAALLSGVVKPAT